MKLIKILFVVNIIVLSALKINAQTAKNGKHLIIHSDTIADKIRGGMLGQIIGNINGIKYEFKFYENPGNVENYIPKLPQGGFTDDDTDFEWVYIYKMQQQGEIYLPYTDINSLWIKTINKRIWCANRFARYLMDIGIAPPYTGNSLLNPWADFNLGGQFLTETFAMVAPGMPQTASKIGLHYTKVVIDDEPAQVTQLFASMGSVAFFEKDINKIIDAGLQGIDSKSIMNRLIADVRKWHEQYPQDWKKCREMIHQNYRYLDDDLMRNRNGVELNTAAIIAALLYGNGDFAKSIELAFNLGYDADCNAATVGAILGTVHGYKNMLSKGWEITDRYKNDTRDGMPLDETITSYSDRVLAVFELVNKENGGKKILIDHIPYYKIIPESPKPVISLKSENEKKVELIADLEKDISRWILSGTKEEKARGAYLAICLDMADKFKTDAAPHWKDACFQLSGYWKIMNNIFYNGVHKSMKNLQKKFIDQGFTKPLERSKEEVIFADKVAWKEPSLLY